MDEQPEPGRRFSITSKVALVGAGVTAGVVLASTLVANAGTSPTPAPKAPAGQPRAYEPHGQLAGTVVSVGASSLTIKVGATATTYTVATSTRLLKGGSNGPGTTTLADIKVGDTVHFAVAPTSATTLAVLIDGVLPAGRPWGPLGGHAPLTAGTVTAVTATSVTIRTATASTTYDVNAQTRVDKTGTQSLDGVKVGDSVHFAVTSGTGSRTLAVLLDGVLPTGARGFGGPDGHGPGHGGFGPGGSGPGSPEAGDGTPPATNSAGTPALS